ncbi:MAG: hypothetical protein ACXVOI_11025 [Tumebacillaceae bacterium]
MNRANRRRRASIQARRSSNRRGMIQRKMGRPSSGTGPSPDSCKFVLSSRRSKNPRQATKDGEHQWLDALDPEFRNKLHWTPPEGSEIRGPVLEGEIFVDMFRPNPEFSQNVPCLVAFDSRTYEGNPAKDRGTHQQFWEDQINIRPFSIEFVKSGIEIWNSLGITISPEQSAFMMKMESIDDQTADAVQAALLNTLNTATYPVDMESIAFALSTFIHAHPAFKSFVSEDRFVMPYGPRTLYALAEN